MVAVGLRNSVDLVKDWECFEMNWVREAHCRAMRRTDETMNVVAEEGDVDGIVVDVGVVVDAAAVEFVVGAAVVDVRDSGT